MSTSQASISTSFNMPVVELVQIKAGVYWGGSLRKLVGVKRIRRTASTGIAKGTVQSSPVAVHKWAARVGMYNDDPIWAAIVKNVRQSRKRQRKSLNHQE